MKVCWKSPANLALIKYWGKKATGAQLPLNPSLSFPLGHCWTQTQIEIGDDQDPVQFFYGEKKRDDFLPKINQFISLFKKEFPSIQLPHLVIRSMNSFPHSAGIASSASAFSALALCFEELFFEGGIDFQRASFMARLGSGSACRSFFPGLSFWGQSQDIKGASDQYSVELPLEQVHPSFRELQNTICILSSEAKSVSSTEGHSLMQESAYTSCRIHQAQTNMKNCLRAMEKGDWELFIRVLEEEALSLHGLMMSHSRGYTLLTSKTWDLIGKIRQERKTKGIKMGFTLDAGPNIHLLYPIEEKKRCLQILGDWAQELNFSMIHSYWEKEGVQKIEL